jgi:glycosyltransferase involved in cell wall biosynthesis
MLINSPAIFKVAWVVHHRSSGGGISPVVQYAANAVSALRKWQITVVFIHDPLSEEIDPDTGIRYLGLDLPARGHHTFLDWLKGNPQDVVVSNHVGEIDYLFPYFPPETVHIAVLHHDGRRYIDQTIALSKYLDGVVAVARHMEDRVRPRLTRQGFRGVLCTVHNGAVFPPLKRYSSPSDRIQLIFIGGPDPFKGIYDTIPLLRKLKRLGVPAHLTIIGGEDEHLKQSFSRAGVADAVTWTGWVPHSQCYDYAAQADIFLMLSRKEPFGMVTIEAMAMGAVPLAYDTESGNREIIENGQSGLLLPLGDIDALTHAIAQHHHERGRLEKLSRGAIIRSRSMFGDQEYGKRLVEAIDTIVMNTTQAKPVRLLGLPPPMRVVNQPFISGYQHLSRALRGRVRRFIGMHAKLCYLLLDRYY